MREQQNNRRDRRTIGLDLGDRWHRFRVLGASGQVVEEGSVANNRVALSELSSRYPGALIVMEAGCHSPWASRHLEQAGCEVIVSNPRKTWAIYQHERKSDRRDALMLARMGLSIGMVAWQCLHRIASAFTSARAPSEAPSLNIPNKQGVTPVVSC